MIIRFDKEDDLFVIPTIVISKIDTKYVKTTNIHIAWLRYSLVFICQNSDTANTKKEKNEKESLLTSNEAKNAKYCIKNDSGMLSVYNATASEKYFDTGVYFEELPDEAKNKVTNGLYFFNETDLYDFLESYSS